MGFTIQARSTGRCPEAIEPGGDPSASACVRRAAVSSGIEAEPFHIDVYLERETARVAPVGELDLATVTRLRERRNEVWASGCRSVVLDLRGLTFIDSSGLHLILEWDSEARETGMEFTVIHGPPAVRRVLDITGLLDWLPFRAMAGSVSPHSRARGQAAGAAAPAR